LLSEVCPVHEISESGSHGLDKTEFAILYLKNHGGLAGIP
jgi:hypothetical protein